MAMTDKYFPYARPGIDESDFAAIKRVLESQYLAQGEEILAFESSYSAAVHATHTITCNSGTAALHLAYMALGLDAEHGLLTSPVTFLATANAARMAGAPVIFADIDPATGNLDPDAVRDVLQKTQSPISAIAPIHLGGRVADMAALKSVADEFGCRIIEDACHAPGAAYLDNNNQHMVGECAHSDGAVFSFHAIKHVAMGEGGALCTNDNSIDDNARLLRSHGMVKDSSQWQHAPEPDAPWYYEMAEVGWNYRITELQAALGRSQLARLPARIRRRQEIAARYIVQLQDTRHLSLPEFPDFADSHVWHLFQVSIDFAALGKSRGDVMRELGARGVGTQVLYIPLYHQPYYRTTVTAPLAGTEAFYARTLAIPMYPELENEDVDRIVETIKSVLTG
jgi:UDP-4-amino-4,6-dideoxy-N-acetyl-beta-L-altrosamine transaminase